MFQRRLNELRVRLLLVPQGPLLIKEGRHLADPQAGRALVREFGDYEKEQLPRVFNPAATRYPAQPRRRDGRGLGTYDSPDSCFDMAFVWSQTAKGPAFYLPGSSLRGVLRSAAERTVARWSPEWAMAGDPFHSATQHWVERQRKNETKVSNADIYRMAGPIERCFGYTSLRGRWTLGDAWMRSGVEAEVVVRDGVGIDRHSGAAMSGIKFQFEAIVGGIFETTLTMVNVELWQLGLLAYSLAALDDGAVRLGYGTRRGLGRVRVGVESLELRWYGVAPDSEGGLVRVPTLHELSERAGLGPTSYGLRDGGMELRLPLQPAEGTLVRSWRIEPARKAEGTDWAASPWPELAKLLPAALSGWEIPAELRDLIGTTEDRP